MRPRLRIVLPIVMGVLTVILTIWDIRNWRVIESMGSMAWDMGAPIWPYQTSDILLHLINFPAYFVGMPLANLLKLSAPKHHLIVFPAVLVWWWFLGKTLDSALVKRPHQRRWFALPVLAVVVALLLWVATSVSANAFHWWLRYGGGVFSLSMLTMLRLLTPAVWCYAFIGLSALAWRRSVAD